jgi:hypothetical protein
LRVFDCKTPIFTVILQTEISVLILNTFIFPMKKFTKKVLLEHLFKSDKEDISKEVIVLFEKFENVREYYKAELSDNSSVLNAYRKKIAVAYSAENPSERRTNMNVNKLIKNFKKISVYKSELIDLLLHRVECGVEAFKRNSKRSETFYRSIENSFEEACKLIVSEKSVSEYENRISAIIENSINGKYQISERMNDTAWKLKNN